MRKVIVQQFVTLDGVMQAPGDPNEFECGGWQRPYQCEDQLTYIVEQAYEAEALLLGRKTYEHFATAWPSMTGMLGLADRMNTMPKFVASRTLKQVEWNATLICGDIAEEVIKLKQQPGRDLLVVGSGDLVQTLIKHNLIDEYRIWVHPVVLGCGQRLFREGSEKIVLSLVDTKTTSTGAVIITYQPVI
jgi:dihydrofolate reductase